MNPVIETLPGRSRGARVMGPLLRRVVWPVLSRGRISPALLRVAHLSDYAGLLLPAPRGTRRQPVPFELFDAELVLGAGVGGAATGGRVVLYFHGGGFFSCGMRTHRRLVARISAAAAAPVLQVAYRQLPIATLDESMQDCLDAYRLLLERGYDGSKVVFAGDSAGGYLAYAVALAAIAEGLPAPAGIAALSPWLDLECTHSLEHVNAATDPYVPVNQLFHIGKLLPGGRDPLEALLDADLSALPPSLIQVGSVEVLRCDAELMAERLAKAGVPIRLQIWERQVHVFQAFADAVPEGHAAIAEIGAFVRATTAARAREEAA